MPKTIKDNIAKKVPKAPKTPRVRKKTSETSAKVTVKRAVTTPKKAAAPKKKAIPKKAVPKKKSPQKITKPTQAIQPQKPWWHFRGTSIALFFISAILVGITLFGLKQHYLQSLKPYLPKIIALPKPATPPQPTQKVMDYDEYQDLNQHITLSYKTRIQAFLETYPDSPLTKKLRNQWLMYLASQQRWDIFQDDYRPTSNQTIECYHLQALYDDGQQTLALSGTERLWQAGNTLSPVCAKLLSLLQNSDYFNTLQIWQRLALAIDKKDGASQTQLIAMLPTNQQALAKNWINTRKNPTSLPTLYLPNDPKGRLILMDILKQWADRNVDKAIAYWQKIQTKYNFDQAAAQEFYLIASLHLALNADPKAESWFAKILPQYATAQSRAWQVRFALMHQQWRNVVKRITDMPDEEQNTNIWQYWKARGLAEIGNTTAANAIYETLSSQRQYYGFLAAYQQHKIPTISQKNYPTDPNLLQPYATQLAHIKNLFEANQFKQVLPLTQDLINQLDPLGQYTLARLFHDWGWYFESMAIVNRLPYQDDLVLRFPMPHKAIILAVAQKNNVSPGLVYAIARQESSFHEDAYSHAGGIGILQLTLATAKQFEPNITQTALLDSNTNIRISLHYLNRLSRQFNGHPLLIAAAYNAGPGSARRWQPKNKALPADIWIETRPWEETRNYLKNTLAYTLVYNYLLGQIPEIRPFMQPIPASPY